MGIGEFSILAAGHKFMSKATFLSTQASHADYHCRQRSLAARLSAARELLLESRILHFTTVIPAKQWRYPCGRSQTGGEQRKIRSSDCVWSYHFGYYVATRTHNNRSTCQCYQCNDLIATYNSTTHHCRRGEE